MNETLHEQPEFYLIIPEFNSADRLCNYHTGEDAQIKVMPDEWERFNQFAGRQHEIVDGIVVYNENLESCMPDELVQSELREVENRLLEILDQERLDAACGVVKEETAGIQAMSLSLREPHIEKERLIVERNRLKQML